MKRPDWDDFCDNNWETAVETLLEKYYDDVLEWIGEQYEDEVYEELRELYEDYGADYGDFLYDQMRDDMLTGDD